MSPQHDTGGHLRGIVSISIGWVAALMCCIPCWIAPLWYWLMQDILQDASLLLYHCILEVVFSQTLNKATSEWLALDCLMKGNRKYTVSQESPSILWNKTNFTKKCIQSMIICKYLNKIHIRMYIVLRQAKTTSLIVFLVVNWTWAARAPGWTPFHGVSLSRKFTKRKVRDALDLRIRIREAVQKICNTWNGWTCIPQCRGTV